jgi:hypothetical protein
MHAERDSGEPYLLDWKVLRIEFWLRNPLPGLF